MPIFAEDISIRNAAGTDADALANLYRKCYAATGNHRRPTQNYPFPQILIEQWVSDAIRQNLTHWLLAERCSRVVGAIGLLFHVGRKDDGIGECFGLAVCPEVRCRGLGRQLLEELRNSGLKDTSVLIGQMRTVNPDVVRVVQRCHFYALGLEPFAHEMLQGNESMITIAAYAPGTLEQRSFDGVTTPAVARLAHLVLPEFPLTPLPVQRGRPKFDNPSHSLIPPRLPAAETHQDAPPQLHHTPQPFVSMRRMDALGRRLRRRRPRCFVVEFEGVYVSSVRISVNQHDHHVRIEEVHTVDDAFLVPTIRAIIDLLTAEVSLPVIVAEVQTSSITAQRALEDAGFHPTAYYPALVREGHHRVDVVQYTWLKGRPLAPCVANVDSLDWPVAQNLVKAIESRFHPRW